MGGAKGGTGTLLYPPEKGGTSGRERALLSPVTKGEGLSPPPEGGGDRRVLSPSPCGEAGIPRDKPLPLSPPPLKGKHSLYGGGKSGGVRGGGERDT
jgi:hypothetical protein